VRDRLMGVETEYAISALTHQGKNFDRQRLLEMFLRAARTQLPHIPDFDNGMFLQNGARFYGDTGQHPELSTPECTDPLAVVEHIRAGECILRNLAKSLEGTVQEISEVQLFRTNVDYSETKATWGCHESYLHRANPSKLPAQIIPHLVSRLIFSGAGGFWPLSNGLDFSLSPRVAHLVHEVSDDSTHNRAIFHTKNETLAGNGYHRLHVICGESLCSETASWLKLGTTALVVTLIEADACEPGGVQLRAPLKAMQIFAKDSQCRQAVQLQNGQYLTAVQIQRHYLGRAEANIGRQFMPEWADTVCRSWRLILDQLECSPGALNTTLDWAIKRSLFEHWARKRGISWESLSQWSHVLSWIHFALAETAYRDKPVSADFILGPDSPIKSMVVTLTPFLENVGLRWENLRRFIALRHELQEIDMRFGQLSEKGIFSSLDKAGLLHHRLPGICDEASSVNIPPAAGRARVRGEFVKQHANHRNRYCCDWQGVWDWQEKRVMDLSDPFETTERWRNFSQDEAEWGPEYAALNLRFQRRSRTR
jgi:proteasome accessory factor A